MAAKSLKLAAWLPLGCTWAKRLMLGLGLGLGLGSGATSAQAQMVISQVYGGNGTAYTNDFVELHNIGSTPVNLSGWSVQYASATGTGNFSGIAALTGTVLPGRFHLVQMAAAAGGSALPSPDSTGTANLSASAGKVILANVSTALPCNGGSTPCNATQLAQILDLVGYGSANFFEGASSAPALTSATAALRGLGGCTDTNNNGADFTNGAPAPRNSASPAVSCGGPASIVVVCPASLSLATGVTADSTLTASDADSIVNSAVFVSGNVPGMSLTAFSAAPGIGAAASVKLSLSSVAAGTYPVVIQFANNSAQTATCSVNISVAVLGAFTPIFIIQGSGSTSALAGQVVTTRGVVTKVNNNGFFIQDALGDGNPLTSDGIFVFSNAAATASAGQLLQVTGTVTEFNTGAATNTFTAARPVTEISFVTSTILAGSGSITPTVISLPLASADDMERYEGMLVQIASPLTASQNYFQGRFGQVTLSAGGRLYKPTNLYRPGSAQAIALRDLNARNILVLDDGTSLQNPNPTPYIGANNTLRAGDTLPGGITGVVDFGLATSDNNGAALYRIHPTVAPVFTRANPRTSAPATASGNVRVASFNVLNFFTTFGNGTTAAGGTGQGCLPGNTAADCRGADNAVEFARQRAKIVQAMAAINADVVGLMEIQNNGNTAVQNLVDALNVEVGAGTYAVVPLPPNTGTDAIRVAMIYKPANLSLPIASMSDSAAIHNRPPFAQTFQVSNGERFSVVVNHFKSKGSCPTDGSLDTDQGDGQGCWNQRRVQQSAALLSFINSVKTASADNDVLVIGDLNAYGQEDPIDVLTAAGFVNQSSRFDGAAAYSYVFDGEAGYLDHALATASLSSQITGTTHWHINADEPLIIDYNLEFKQPACAGCGPDYFSATPYRSSDHDPVVVSLNLLPPQPAQTISFASIGTQLANTQVTLNATATSGLAVSFSSLTPSVCSVITNLATLLTAGSCTIAADQAGNAAFAAAPQVQRIFSISLAPQTISFNALANQELGAPPFTPAATASSGLAVTLTSLTPGVCSVSASTVSLATTGTCTLIASQAGNTSFSAAASVTRSFTVTVAVAAQDGDVPLPPWALLLLTGSLVASLARKRRKQSVGSSANRQSGEPMR